MKLLLDTKRFNKKPTPQDAMRLTKTLLQSEVELPPYDVAVAIGDNGQSFCSALMRDANKTRSRANWRSQMLFCLDFDNNGTDLLKPHEAIAIYQKASLPPFACYETFSSTEALPKFRLMFVVKEPILDYDEAKTIVNGLARVMEGCDALDAGVGRDLARLFYGGKKLLHFEETFLGISNLPLPTVTVTVTPPKEKLLLMDELSVTELEDFQKILKGVRKALSDPLRKKPSNGFNHLQKGNRYQTLLHSVNWLMTMSPVTLSKDEVEDFVLSVVDNNREEWYDVEWDISEKLSLIYDWCELNGTGTNISTASKTRGKA